MRALPSRDLAFIAERTRMAFTPEASAIAAVDNAGRVRGMVAYDDWKPGSVQMHVRLDSWGATRCLLRPAFWFPFVQAGKTWVMAQVQASNERSTQLVRRLGFEVGTVLRDGWAPGDDLVIWVMHREACRWIRQRSVA